MSDQDIANILHEILKELKAIHKDLIQLAEERPR